VFEFKRIVPAAERIGALAELIEIFAGDPRGALFLRVSEFRRRPTVKTSTRKHTRPRRFAQISRTAVRPRARSLPSHRSVGRSVGRWPGAKTEIRNSSVRINARSVKINRRGERIEGGTGVKLAGAYFYTAGENSGVRTAGHFLAIFLR